MTAANQYSWSILSGVNTVICDLKSKPCENFVADFCTSALLKALKATFFTLKKEDGQAFRSAEVQKSTSEFSHGLDLKHKTQKSNNHSRI